MPENENEAKIELTKSPSLDEFLRARHQRMPSFEFKIDEKDKKEAKKQETESKTPIKKLFIFSSSSTKRFSKTPHLEALNKSTRNFEKR
ncbi:hypothetical protein niasHT_014203 [Heterodera trifolii]|uniref:Uncharacterized protein n=1 Tax=Heterodera trifolii TaxID=157864 RepID=A0ABD2KXB0_9BILA